MENQYWQPSTILLISNHWNAPNGATQQGKVNNMNENQKRGRGRPKGMTFPNGYRKKTDAAVSQERGRPRTKSAVWSPADIR